MTETTEGPVELAGPSMLSVKGLPSPIMLERQMTERVEAEIRQERERRGAVHTAEDTFALIRKAGGALIYLAGYERALKAVRKRLTDVVEEEASDAGNHTTATATSPRWNGAAVPAANVTVPDEDGDIHITREFDREVWVDWRQVLTPGAHAAARAWTQAGAEDVEFTEAELEICDELASVVLDRVLKDLELAASKLSPKTSGLEQLAAIASRAGDDLTASLISGAWSVKRLFKGVKVERS